MKKIKKLMALLLALTLMSTVIIGCGSNNEQAAEPVEGGEVVEQSGLPEGYPSQDMIGMVPYGAGGGTDNIARAVSNNIDIPVNVAWSIVTGASGLTGSTEFSTWPGDGYHIMSQSPLDLMCYYLGGATDEKLWEKMEPIGCMVIDPGIVITNQESGIKDFEDLKTRNPADINCAVVTNRQMVGAMKMFEEFGMDGINMVPFSSGSDAITAILGNQIDIAVLQIGDLGDTVASVNPLLIIDEKRCEKVPDVPCTEELGVQVVGAQYRALFLAGGTDPAIVQYWSDKCAELQSDPDYLKDLEGFGFIQGFLTADELKAKMDEWYPEFEELFAKYGV